ncbi:GNAT superfamily N-acetyltransferase [Arcanobacterium wilhelmae]|uniref:GNAT superfamily N-acetyltransferase n=1 Tax=Arcanobacterium wilhelmae TaxID=1803177 RepID=A0ABT9NB97_9ACTO|nr:GNAT family N-acetyltransferase [Arcanobacterium wilhelmae]MDP9800994.1 GNAT superfamily N-acetyltransferase [Arcanobacterium wilhelmae]WFN90354.1 GNAT family N-acetyltransferase [Arcanobacterium wilhelmae]
MIQISPALPSDTAAIVALRRSREAWMRERGVHQWLAKHLPAEEIEEQVAAGLWWVVRAGSVEGLLPDAGGSAGAGGSARTGLPGSPAFTNAGPQPANIGAPASSEICPETAVGAVRIEESDELIGDPSVYAIYPHSLMSDPRLSGNGIGAGIVREVERIARERGAEQIRIDCMDWLVDFYRGFGYVPTGEKVDYDDGIISNVMVLELR